MKELKQLKMKAVEELDKAIDQRSYEAELILKNMKGTLIQIPSKNLPLKNENKYLNCMR